MIRILKDDRYFRTDVKYNEDFLKFLDFAVDLITKKKIKEIHLGTDYHYMTYNGKIKAYMAKRARANDKQLIIKGDNFELECTLHAWDEITFKDKEIEIGNGFGLFITFEKPIRREYNKREKEIKKEIEEEKEDDSSE